MNYIFIYSSKQRQFVTRNAYYKPAGKLFNVMLGVNVTCELNESIEHGARVIQRTKSDFIRIILEKGLKAVHKEQQQPRDT